MQKLSGKENIAEVAHGVKRYLLEKYQSSTFGICLNASKNEKNKIYKIK